MPAETAADAPVSLSSIFHHRGVNALAEDQTLKFGPNLTVVYGDNAAGKSGYIRILKSACRARGQEQILGNVTSGTTPLSPVVSIRYGVGDEKPREWTGEGDDSSISRVSVFDTQCAAVYLTEKTDVAFRPFGLDLFDKLVRACKSVRAKLEAEQNVLSANALTAMQADIPVGTAAAKFLAGISSLTKPETVQAMASLSSEEDARLAEVEKSLGDLQANDPVKLAQQLDLRAGRLEAFARQLRDIEATLATGAIADVFAVRAEGYRKSGEAKLLREAAFPANMLPGTGAETWAALWEAARKFSQESAYPRQTFPVVNDGATCVLCQQELDHAASHRFTLFEAFVASTTEKELRELRASFAQLKKAFTDIQIVTPAVEDLLNEIRIEHEPLAASIAAALATNEQRRKAVVSALAENKDDLAADCPDPVDIAHEVDAFAAQLRSRVKTLRDSATNQVRSTLFSDALELRARKALAKHQQAILDDIERRKKYAAYGLCLEETKTQTITQKSTAVTKTAVSQKLKQRFKDELVQLGFRHVEVELREAGGADGVLYHKLVLARAPGVELPKVVSEGEQRCLSIAAFFAELSTADDPSGIVFDDPVSSLDYRYREAVARRLVVESNARQVIVFTHDVVFLLFLKQYAAELNINQLDQHIRQLSKGAGVCEEELPWVALPIKKKIGHLKNARQAADKLFRDGHQDAYEKDAKHLYGLLREAWERALEEVLLNGIVERYRPSVQTQRLAMISDVTNEDCQALDAAMTKCSRWLPGHDQAAAARAPVPEPTELKDDIDALESWVATIQKRRR